MAPRGTTARAAKTALTNTPEGASGKAGTAPSADSGDGAIEAPPRTESAPPHIPEADAAEPRLDFQAVCLVGLDGQTFAPGAALALTRAQHAELRVALAIAEDWPD